VRRASLFLQCSDTWWLRPLRKQRRRRGRSELSRIVRGPLEVSKYCEGGTRASNPSICYIEPMPEQSIIVWDLETIPDLSAAARMLDMSNATEPEVRDVLGEGFPSKSLGDPWADTTTPHGKLMITVLGGLAEFERHLILSRTSEGRARAKANEVKFGRRPKLTKHQITRRRRAADARAC
jgi:Resolvase, N terminal domain